MSQENVEIVRRMYEAFHSGDAEGAVAFFDPEVVVDASFRVDAGVDHGHEGLNRIIRSWIGTFEGWREEIEEILDLGSRVLVVSTQSGRGKGSGAEVEQRYAIVYEVEGEKITRMTMYANRAQALKAAEAD